MTRVRVVALSFAVAIASGGCDTSRAGYEVWNRSHQPIDVYWVSPDRRERLAEQLEPGHYTSAYLVRSGECHEKGIHLEALDQEGLLIGRLDVPICDGTVWEVREP